MAPPDRRPRHDAKAQDAMGRPTNAAADGLSAEIGVSLPVTAGDAIHALKRCPYSGARHHEDAIGAGYHQSGNSDAIICSK